MLDDADIAAAAERIPELPLARGDRLIREHALTPADAAQLVEERARADYFEALIAAGASAAEANNLVRNDIGRWLNEHGVEFADFPLPAAALVELVVAVRDGVIPAAAAGKVMERMAATGGAAADIIAEEGLEQISGSDELAPVVDEVLAAHPDEVAAFRGGKDQVLGYLMGQIMRATQGKANPETVRRLLQERLGQAPGQK
jgi:aspartyl-tRNA(Asn)/glutamyl-tRNA(Gln) amidotransferase subunit B